METYYEDDISRIYVTDAPDNEHWGDTIFETKALGDTRSYRLSCNPYEPVTMLENLNVPSDRVNLHGMMLPSENAEIETWVGFIKVLIAELIKALFEGYTGKDTISIKYMPGPNKQGVFEYNGDWYIFSTDEKAYPDITGPFNENEVVYALALELHLGKEPKLRTYKFSDKARETFIHNHFRSLGEIDENKNETTFDEKILAYNMNSRDERLANIAQLIVCAYNGEQKPHRIPKEREIAPPYYRWKHSPEGYSLLTSETEDFSSPTVLLTDAHINDFVEHVFLVLAGDTTVKWNKVYTSKAVLLALEKYFGMNVDLSNIGPNHVTEGIFGVPKLPARPTIWADVDLKLHEDAWKIMEEKGFDYWDRNRWCIEL